MIPDAIETSVATRRRRRLSANKRCSPQMCKILHFLAGLRRAFCEF